MIQFLVTSQILAKLWRNEWRTTHSHTFSLPIPAAFAIVHLNQMRFAMRPATTRRAYNVREFCEEFGLSREGVYEAIRLGKLVARKYGKRTIITDEAANAFLNALPRLHLPPSGETQ